MTQTTSDSIALQLIVKEKTAFESGLAYVTSKIAYKMQGPGGVIEQCRKNYWGVFDSPIDPSSGREKVWQHLTKQFVDFVVKNVDLDTKDIQFYAKSPESRGLTNLVRHIIKNELDEARFGETLDLIIRQLAIDGTVVVSTEMRNGKLDIKIVDLLNFFIDPVANSIADANSVIERIVLPLSEFQRLAKKNDWKNKDIQGILDAARTSTLPNATPKSEVHEVELWRRRGLAALFSDTEEPTEIIASCTNGTWLIHDFSKRKDNRDKGYEEAWYTRVHGRWYGEGVAERLQQYQIWYNTTRNIRINRAFLTQLGLWAIRKGSGVTPQMLSRLSANGAIPVGDVNNDIKQIPMQDASPASYKDDEVIYTEAQRTTGAFDTAVGDSLPASTPATNAAIQNQGAQSHFTLIREGIGMFMERLIENRIMPLAFADLKVNDLIRMHCDQDELQEIDEMTVNQELYEQLEALRDQGLFIDPMQVEAERQRAMQMLQAQGKQRFVTLLQSMDVSEFDVDVQITNEDQNTPVMVQNINSMIQVLGSLGLTDAVIDLTKQEADLLGLDGSKIKPPQPMQPGFNQAQSMNPQMAPGGNPTQQYPQTLIDNYSPAVTQEPS